MKAKNDLLKSFKKAATRASLIVLLTVGVVAPNIQCHADKPVAPDTAATAVIPAPPAADSVTTELQFAPVKDLNALAKQYPALSNLPAEVRELDEQVDADHAAVVQYTTYKDNANNREFLAVHINSPIVCSYEGCPLTVYLKEGDTYRKVMQGNTEFPVELVSAKGVTSIMMPPTLDSSKIEFRYNPDAKEFQLYKPAGAAQSPAPGAPAPAPAPAPQTP